MLKKLFVTTFLLSLASSSVGCFVRTSPAPAGKGHRCGVGTTWDGRRCAPNRPNQPPNAEVTPQAEAKRVADTSK